MSPIKFSVRLSWRYLGASLCVLLCFGSRTCLCSSTAMLVGNPAPRKRAFCRQEFADFGDRGCELTKYLIGFLVYVRLAQVGFLIFGEQGDRDESFPMEEKCSKGDCPLFKGRSQLWTHKRFPKAYIYIIRNLYIFEIAAVAWQNFVGYAPRAKILEILGDWYIFEITLVSRQNALALFRKRKYWKSQGICLFLRSLL